ncbi:lectin C-type domain protein, partial [Oesophagostomum dentatum]
LSAIIDACWNAAKRSCRKSGNGKGYLANEFDLDKHKFIAATFKEQYNTISPPYMYHIGLSYNAKKGQFYWEQPVGSDPLPLEEGSFTRWNRGYPLAKNLLESNRCVLNAQTSTAFNLFWQNENCKSVPRRYVCQMNSCDTDNYCESYKFHS